MLKVPVGVGYTAWPGSDAERAHELRACVVAKLVRAAADDDDRTEVRDGTSGRDRLRSDSHAMELWRLKRAHDSLNRQGAENLHTRPAPA